MKIALPTVDTHEHKNVLAAGLNANGCICLYDMQAKSGKWFKTSEVAADMGSLLPALEALSISVIIAENMHPMALKILINKGFKVYKACGQKLSVNIEMFEQNALSSYTHEAAMMLADVCGGECTSCDSATCDETKKEN